MKKLKTIVLSVGMILSMSVMILPQSVSAEPTVQQTMDWLTDYLVRRSSPSCSYHTIKASYDSQRHLLKYEVEFDDNKPNKTISIPLDKVEKITLQGEGRCLGVKVYGTGLIYGGKSSGSWVKLGRFLTKESAERAMKGLRHAVKLLQPKELF